jgi:hypothetical protein
MLFTNNQKNTIKYTPIPQTYSNAFSSKYLRSHTIRPITTIPANIPKPAQNTQTLKETPANEPEPKKMKWGEPTWAMFHIIAEKIKPELFIQYRSELLNIVNTVCNTLPCPICANHATQYMRNIREHHFPTKRDFQEFLWTFHNSVNERKGHPFFTIDQLHEKYSTMNTRIAINNFIIAYEQKHTGIRLVVEDFYRNKVFTLLRNWFIRNIHIFDN